jgi:hypothetical protein
MRKLMKEHSYLYLAGRELTAQDDLALVRIAFTIVLLEFHVN